MRTVPARSCASCRREAGRSLTLTVLCADCLRALDAGAPLANVDDDLRDRLVVDYRLRRLPRDAHGFPVGF